MDGTLIIGAIGLVTTAIAGPLNGIQSSRTEQRKWLRDQRAQALTEAVAYAQNLYSRLEYLGHPYMRAREDRAPLVHADVIAAHLRLAVTKDVFKLWRVMRTLEEWLMEDMRNHYPTGEIPDVENYHPLANTLDAIETFLAGAETEFDG
jgi:hypothetical protein